MLFSHVLESPNYRLGESSPQTNADVYAVVRLRPGNNNRRYLWVLVGKAPRRFSTGEDVDTTSIMMSCTRRCLCPSNQNEWSIEDEGLEYHHRPPYICGTHEKRVLRVEVTIWNIARKTFTWIYSDDIFHKHIRSYFNLFNVRLFSTPVIVFFYSSFVQEL